MQLRNKSFGLLCGILVSALAIIGTPAFAEEETVQMYFSEGFDGYNSGQAPNGWTMVDNGNKISVENVPSETNKSLKYTVSDKDAYVQKSALGISARQFVVDFCVRVDSTTLGGVRIELRDASGKGLVPASLKNGQIALYDYFSIGRYNAGKFYRISLAFDLDTKRVSAWVNGSQRARNYSIGDAMPEDLAFIRLHTTEISEKSSVYWDYISVYGGTEPVAIEENGDSDESIGGSGVSYTMKNAVAMYENRPWALVGGKKSEIDKDKEIVPFSNGNVMYLPLRFIANSFGASVEYNADSGNTAVTYGGKTYTLSGADNVLISDGETYRIDAPVINKNDRLFIPVSAIYNIFGKEVFIDENGLMVFSDESNFVSWEENFDLLNDTVKAFIYTDYSSEELLEMFRENNPDNAHPRVMVNADTFSKMRELVAADEFAKAAYQDVVAKADEYLAEKPSVYDIPDGIRLLTTCRRVQDRVATLALVYNISGDEKYAKRAWEELYIAAYFPNWNESHFLDAAEMSAAFAIGYDWLYSYLNDEQKQIMKTAMVEYGLKKGMEDYLDSPRKRTYAWSTADNANNWTFVCNGGLAMSAIALLGEGEDELCAEVLSNGLVNLRRALGLFAPSGSYGEGMNYWEYATRFFVFHISSLQSAFGSDLGYFDVPGIRNTVEFVESLNGPAGGYNFSDAPSTANSIRESQMLWFANKLGKEYLAANRIDEILEGRRTAEWRDILYYTPDLGGDGIEMPLDKYSDVVEVMTMRNSWHDDALYVGFHNGNNAESHSHLDIGGFILDLNGKRFITELGYDDYNLPGSVYNRYRYRAEGHNTLVINPDANPDQATDAVSKIVRYETKPRGAYAIADLTPAYEDAEEILRGIMMCEGRNAVVVSDEISLKDNSEVWWFAHTQNADIELLDSGRTAVITKSGKKLKAEILSEGGNFEVMDAKPFETTPAVAGQNENAEFQKLAIHLTDFKDGNITVGFTDYYSEYSFDEVLPLAEWSISDGEPEYGIVDNISVDGETISGFSPDIYSYTVTIPADQKERNIVTSDGEVIDKRIDGRADGTVVIKSNGADGKMNRTYTVAFVKAPMIGLPDDKTLIRPAAYKGSDEPQPENPVSAAFDGNMTTRWAAEGHCWLDITLGAETPLYGVGVALWKGNERISTLKIEISSDGENYSTVYSGSSSGFSEDYEVFEAYGASAKYVRVHAYGTTAGSWNSILGVAILGGGSE